MTEGRHINFNDTKFALNISDSMNFEAAADDGEVNASKSNTTGPKTTTKDDSKIGNVNMFKRRNIYI